GDGTDLGEVNWREGSLEAEFVITNSGNELFRPTHFALESGGESVFRFERLFASLPPGESRVLRISFDPAGPGPVETELVIYGARANGNAFRFSLLGTGVAPDQLPDQLAGRHPASLLGNNLYNETALGQTAFLTMR